jgi:hypothetical protein
MTHTNLSLLFLLVLLNCWCCYDALQIQYRFFFDPRILGPGSNQIWESAAARLGKMLHVVKGGEAEAGVPVSLLTAAPVSCGPRIISNRVHADDVHAENGTLKLPQWDAILVYVYADTTVYACTMDASVVAFSSVCMSDIQAAGRPVLGYINLCTPSFYLDPGGIRAMATHELLHVIGFNAETFARAFPLTFPRYNSVGRVEDVKAFVQSHYGCSAAAGSLPASLFFESSVFR